MIRDSKQLVETVGQLLRTCERFRVQLTPEEACQVLKRLERYNDIPADISKLPAVIHKRFGDEARIELGNEYSLVIYIYVRGLFNPEVLLETNRFLVQTGRTFKASEVDVERKDTGLEARLWWD